MRDQGEITRLSEQAAAEILSGRGPAAEQTPPEVQASPEPAEDTRAWTPTEQAAAEGGVIPVDEVRARAAQTGSPVPVAPPPTFGDAEPRRPRPAFRYIDPNNPDGDRPVGTRRVSPAEMQRILAERRAAEAQPEPGEPERPHRSIITGKRLAAATAAGLLTFSLGTGKAQQLIDSASHALDDNEPHLRADAPKGRLVAQAPEPHQGRAISHAGSEQAQAGQLQSQPDSTHGRIHDRKIVMRAAPSHSETRHPNVRSAQPHPAGPEVIASGGMRRAIIARSAVPAQSIHSASGVERSGHSGQSSGAPEIRNDNTGKVYKIGPRTHSATGGAAAGGSKTSTKSETVRSKSGGTGLTIDIKRSTGGVRAGSAKSSSTRAAAPNTAANHGAPAGAPTAGTSHPAGAETHTTSPAPEATAPANTPSSPAATSGSHGNAKAAPGPAETSGSGRATGGAPESATPASQSGTGQTATGSKLPTGGAAVNGATPAQSTGGTAPGFEVTVTEEKTPGDGDNDGDDHATKVVVSAHTGEKVVISTTGKVDAKTGQPELKVSVTDQDDATSTSAAAGGSTASTPKGKPITARARSDSTKLAKAGAGWQSSTAAHS